MNEERFKNLYNYMNKNGELKKLMPKMTGEWETDKSRFIRYQLEMEEMANVKNLEC